MEERAFIEYVAEHLESPISVVQQALGFSGYKAQRIRDSLVKEGLLLVVETRLGRRGTLAKFGVPTLKAQKLLGKALPGRGGPVHRHCQALIAANAKTLGFEVQIEKRLASGGYIDVHLETERTAIAVEVSVVPEIPREIRNIQKCLDAGYEHVVCLMADKHALEPMTIAVSRVWPDEIEKRVIVSHVEDFEAVLRSVSGGGI